MSDEAARLIHEGHVFNMHSKGTSRKFSMEMRESSHKVNLDKYEYEVSAGLEWAQIVMNSYPLPEKPEVSLINIKYVPDIRYI